MKIKRLNLNVEKYIKSSLDAFIIMYELNNLVFSELRHK